MPLSRPVLACLGAAALFGPVAAAAQTPAVTSQPGTVNGFAVTIWRWIDAHGLPRTVSLKKEGHGNRGHGGYAVQMTYYTPTASGNYALITVNPDMVGTVDGLSDGGFGYFVSHERYRRFQDGTIDSIAHHIFGVDDSPLGRRFAATVYRPAMPEGAGAEEFTIQYAHYGTTAPHPVDPTTGLDATTLPTSPSSFRLYPLPVTTSWVFQTGTDYPRIHVAVDLSHIVPPGGTAPTADLVSFDLRGPYGAMLYDNGGDGPIETALWGDREYLFTTLSSPAKRSSPWNWSQHNTGARFNAQIADDGFEMGLYEPVPASASHLDDGYAAERGYSSTSFATMGGTSHDFCPTDDPQTLPSDANWPYQSIQYSLPCPASVNQPATLKKIAWGSALYYGTSLSEVYDGRRSFPIDAFPADHMLKYNICVVLGRTGGTSLTQAAAAAYTDSGPVKPLCATAPL
jgi:hypothetical protein